MSTGPRPKPVRIIGGDIKTPPLSPEARREAGQLIRMLQQGDSIGMPLSRPMPTIGPGCHELRVRDSGHNWRIFYRIDVDAIVIIEVVAKTTRATPKPVIDRCQRRLATYDHGSEEENGGDDGPGETLRRG